MHVRVVGADVFLRAAVGHGAELQWRVLLLGMLELVKQREVRGGWGAGDRRGMRRTSLTWFCLHPRLTYNPTHKSNLREGAFKAVVLLNEIWFMCNFLPSNHLEIWMRGIWFPPRIEFSCLPPLISIRATGYLFVREAWHRVDIFLLNHEGSQVSSVGGQEDDSKEGPDQHHDLAGGSPWVLHRHGVVEDNGPQKPHGLPDGERRAPGFWRRRQGRKDRGRVIATGSPPPPYNRVPAQTLTLSDGTMKHGGHTCAKWGEGREIRANGRWNNVERGNQCFWGRLGHTDAKLCCCKTERDSNKRYFPLRPARLMMKCGGFFCFFFKKSTLFYTKGVGYYYYYFFVLT